MNIRFEIVDPAATRELRRAVLRPDQSPDEPLPGDELPDGVHIGAVDQDDGRVLCTCFVYPDPCPWLPERAAWRLRQMATLPAHRGRGLGGGVVEKAAELGLEHGAEILWCNAREPALAFYARHGFQPVGELFTDEHKIPHQRMWRELSGAPASSQS